MRRALKASFNGNTLDQLFVQQLDDFSCAAAVCATVARLYGLDASLDLKFFRKALRLTFDGATGQRIARVCKQLLRPEKTENNGYHGGIAFGFIRHKPDGEDHAVLFLARKDRTLIYYDPFERQIFRDNVRNMARGQDRADPYRLWTAKFPSIPGAGFDFWNKRAKQNPYNLRHQHFWLREHGKALVL